MAAILAAILDYIANINVFNYTVFTFIQYLSFWGTFSNYFSQQTRIYAFLQPFSVWQPS